MQAGTCNFQYCYEMKACNDGKQSSDLAKHFIVTLESMMDFCYNVLPRAVGILNLSVYQVSH